MGGQTLGSALSAFIAIAVILALIAGLFWIESSVKQRLFHDVVSQSVKGWRIPARRVTLADDMQGFELFHTRWINILAVVALVMLTLLALDIWELAARSPSSRPWSVHIQYGVAAFFGTWAVLLALSKETKLVVSGPKVIHQRPYRRAKHYDLGHLIHVKPIDNDYAKGVWLMFRDGRNLHVGNTMHGLFDLITHLTRYHPNATEAHAYMRDLLAEKG